MNCCLQKLYYTSIYIFYLLFISRQFQKCKNDVNPTSTSKDTEIPPPGLLPRHLPPPHPDASIEVPLALPQGDLCSAPRIFQ